VFGGDDDKRTTGTRNDEGGQAPKKAVSTANLLSLF